MRIHEKDKQDILDNHSKKEIMDEMFFLKDNLVRVSLKLKEANLNHDDFLKQMMGTKIF